MARDSDVTLPSSAQRLTFLSSSNATVDSRQQFSAPDTSSINTTAQTSPMKSPWQQGSQAKPAVTYLAFQRASICQCPKALPTSPLVDSLPQYGFALPCHESFLSSPAADAHILETLRRNLHRDPLKTLSGSIEAYAAQLFNQAFECRHSAIFSVNFFYKELLQACEMGLAPSWHAEFFIAILLSRRGFVDHALRSEIDPCASLTLLIKAIDRLEQWAQFTGVQLENVSNLGQLASWPANSVDEQGDEVAELLAAAAEEEQGVEKLLEKTDGAAKRMEHEQLAEQVLLEACRRSNRGERAAQEELPQGPIGDASCVRRLWPSS
jgi:hypothetical protein